MDGGDRRRWGGRCGGPAGDDRKVIDQMTMLRFRPIAPRPADGGGGDGMDQLGNKSLLLWKFRTKRKYVRVRSRSKNKSDNHQRKAELSSEKAIMTLQLLPERADDQKVSSKSVDKRSINWLLSSPSSMIHTSSPSPSISPCPNPHPRLMINCTDLTARASRIESWVIVESVGTSASLDALELGLTDDEKAGKLRSSSCPGFMSDLSNRVQWINRAYENMVQRGFSGGRDSPTEVAVGLSVKCEKVGLPRWFGAFTCRVRVQDTWREVRRSRVVPCDVWRMDSGGFAWRLDVEAALSLGSF